MNPVISSPPFSKLRAGTRQCLVRAGLAFLVAGFLLPVGKCPAQKSAKEIYDQVAPSVVAITDVAGSSGTGVVLDISGLILTNEHVIESAQKLTCVIDVRKKGGNLVASTFTDVQVVGTHPKKDLALIRVNPLEHSGELVPATFTRMRMNPGDQIYAIGNPAAGSQVLNKTITEGLISGVDRVLQESGAPDEDPVKYYQISAAINPGNSGGPVVNNNGEVIGIATAKILLAENVGFVLPVSDFATSSISVQPGGREVTGAQQARAAIAEAVSILQTMQRSSDDRARAILQLLAGQKYHEAIQLDPDNWAIQYNLGLILDRNGAHSEGVSWLAHAIKLAPWEMNDDRIYRQLALALKNDNRLQDAMVVLDEGRRKFPRSGWCWELWARWASEGSDPAGAQEEIALAAAVAAHCKPSNVSLKSVEKLRDDALGTLAGLSRADAKGRIANIPGMLTEWEIEAQAARAAGKPAMTEPFSELLESLTAIDVRKIKMTMIAKDSFFKESPAWHGNVVARPANSPRAETPPATDVSNSPPGTSRQTVPSQENPGGTSDVDNDKSKEETRRDPSKDTDDDGEAPAGDDGG